MLELVIWFLGNYYVHCMQYIEFFNAPSFFIGDVLHNVQIEMTSQRRVAKGTEFTSL